MYLSMSNIKPIIEYDPFITEVYIRRYFWLKPFIKINREPDVNFIYSQAREYVFNPKFTYKDYKFIDLAAIDLMIKYSTYDQAKKVIKKSKKKQRETMFPKYIYDSHKNLKNTMKQTKQYEGRQILDLKKAFILLCLQNKFFALNIYPVKCCIPESGDETPKDYFLTLDEEILYILDPKTRIILYRLELKCISRYQIVNEFIEFVVIGGKIKTDGKTNARWRIAFKNTQSFFEYFTNLIHFVKHESL